MGEEVGDGAGRMGRHNGIMALKGITKGTKRKDSQVSTCKLGSGLEVRGWGGGGVVVEVGDRTVQMEAMDTVNGIIAHNKSMLVKIDL